MGNAIYAKYLLFPYIPGAGELMIFCGAMGGAGLAFLWYNTHPAQVFMGDVGALALGGALGTIAAIGLLGMIDESLQSLLPYRNASLADWCFDIGAAASVTALLLLIHEPTLPKKPHAKN